MPLAAIAAARFAARITPAVGAGRLGRDPDRRRAGGARLASARRRRVDGAAAAGDRRRARPRAVRAVTERALAGRSAQAVHGGWTIAARHAGVVLGLAAADADLHDRPRTRTRTTRSPRGTAAVLDSRIPPLEKIAVARDILVAVDEAKEEARIPDVHGGRRRARRPGLRRPRLGAAGSARPRGHERVLARVPRRRAARTRSRSSRSCSAGGR